MIKLILLNVKLYYFCKALLNQNSCNAKTHSLYLYRIIHILFS